MKQGREGSKIQTNSKFMRAKLSFVKKSSQAKPARHETPHLDNQTLSNRGTHRGRLPDLGIILAVESQVPVPLHDQVHLLVIGCYLLVNTQC